MPTTRSARVALDSRTSASVEQLLRTRRAELTDKVGGLMETAARAPGRMGADQPDRTAATCQTEIEAAHLDRLARQLADVEAALVRLSCGEYGVCDECGQFIGLARLKSLPFTRLCRPCRSRSEGVSVESVPTAEPSHLGSAHRVS
jgi:DnaK suppressor protein